MLKPLPIAITIATLASIFLIVVPIALALRTKLRCKQKQKCNEFLHDEKSYRLIFEKAGEAVLILDGESDIQGKIIACNQAAADMYGYSIDEMQALHIGDVSDISYSLVNDKLKQIANGEWIRLEFNHRKKDGNTFPVEMNAGAIEISSHKRILAFCHDITDRKEAEDMLNYMAYYDSLTALPNRTLFNGHLILALDNAKQNESSFAIMFLDLDNFKTINDTLGHILGDRLLRDIAERLSDCLHGNNIVARLGGDEFVFLLSDIDTADDACAVAQKIINILQSPFVLDGRAIHVTTSIGVATYPDDGIDTQTLMRNADVALYQAKEQGRNTYRLYLASMNSHAFKRFSIENGLRRALDNDELFLFYQPQVELSTGRIIGMEALLRWQHPEMGSIPPSEFIPIAESAGLILPIGDWVLHEACRQNKEWQNQGYTPIRMSVNLSALQFQQHNLAGIINSVLDEVGLDPSYLDIEITETAIVKDLQKTTATLCELKKRGISISIDDFGTGYSSLGHLKKFPIDTLKIDRIFIDTFGIDPSDEAIIRAILTMGHGLGLKVVAEGVETIKQAEFLRKIGCDVVQGFLFSRPLSAQKAAEFLASDTHLCA